MHGRASAAARIAVAVLLTAPLWGASAVTVTVDGSQTYQVIEGFGANINHRSWNNDELKPVLDRLIDDLGMTIFRVIFDNADWETSNDNTNSSVMNWSYYNQIYSSTDFQKLWDISVYLNQRGITDGLMFNFQGTGPDWMLSGDYLTSGYEQEWAEMIASVLIYARNTQHIQFSIVGPGNEEDIPIQGIDMTPSQYTTALHKLSQLLDTNGLSDVRFVGPDLATTDTTWLSAMMTDPLVMGKLAHFGLHSYYDNGSGSTGVDNFIKQSAYPDQTFWMTEFNTWCTPCESNQSGDDTWSYAKGAASRLIYHLAYGATAALVWEGYDGQYNYFSPPGQWSYWGLLAVDNINATPKTYSPRRTYYTLAQTTKFVRPGAAQIDVSGSPGPLVFLGFYQPDAAQLTLTGLNTDTSATTLTAILTNLPAISSLDLYYTDSTTNLCHSATYPVINGSVTATIPADCVFTLVGVDPNSVALSVAITNPPPGTLYHAPATISIQASATTTTGSVSQVEFYAGPTDLGGATSPPYELTWSNVPAGSYTLTARATNSVGNYRISTNLQVTVVGPLAQISVTPSTLTLLPYSTQQFIATAADALGTALSPQPSFSWSVSGGGTINGAGLFIAGSAAGGPFIVSATNSGIGGSAAVDIVTNLNVAPLGAAYTWHGMSSATGNSPQTTAPGINDDDTDTDVSLLGGPGVDVSNAYEAAGVIWPTPQLINQVIYWNGSYTSDRNGVFASGFRLQFSPDGTTWTNAGAAWVLSPAYAYNSSSSGDTSFTFTGGSATVLGVRCVGRVHTSQSSLISWFANATEVQAFAAPPPPPAVLIASAVSNGIALSWPAPLTNYYLEAATDALDTGSWTAVTNPAQPTGDMLNVTLPMDAATHFFRLHQQ